jgi:hypothetical protein
MPRIRRVVGDEGAKARITLTDVKDAQGELVTSGTLTLRADGLFEGSMTHDDGGTWFYDPVAGDLSSSGVYRLEATSADGSTVTIPGGDPWELHVRARGASPA